MIYFPCDLTPYGILLYYGFQQLEGIMPTKKKSATKTKKKQAKKAAPKKAATIKAATIKAATKKAAPKKAAPKKAAPKKAAKKAPKKAPAQKRSAKRRRAQPAVITSQPVEKPKRKALPVYKAYENALKVFYKKDYAKAKERLTQVLAKFPKEAEVLVRVQSFLRVCERQLESHKKKASSPEEIFNQGVFYHNSGQYERALENYSRALKLSKKDQDHIYYAMAATKLSMGNTNTALQHLEKAIQMNQENRFFAHNDPDFQLLATDQKFQELIQPD
jgi:tetratricopeptide (TPR) repeat protein